MKAKNIRVGDVWFAEFPLEEDTSQIIERPVIILDAGDGNVEVLCCKVTKHSPRAVDQYDTPIVLWQEAGLRFPSTARISKTMILPKTALIFRIGSILPDDLANVTRIFVNYIETKK